MSNKKRSQYLCIMIPVCICIILIMINIIQYFSLYKVLNELYRICMESSGNENVVALVKYINNLEMDSLLTTGLTVICIVVIMWIGVNIYNAVNKQDMEKLLQEYSENLKISLKNYYDKKIEDLDEQREEKTQYLTRKAELANLLYLTGEQYYSSNFFANLLWKTKTEYSYIDNTIKYERKYIQCCRAYEKNEMLKSNMLARELIDCYRELMSEMPYTIWNETDTMKNFLRMRLSDVLFYKNMTATARNFNMEEVAESVEYYEQIINHPSELKVWDKEIEAYFLNSQGYTLYHMSRHALDEKKGEYLDQALDKLKRAVEKMPYKGRYRRNLGLIYQAMGKYEDARKIYIKAFETDPGDYKAYNTVVALDLKELDRKISIDNRLVTGKLLNEIVIDNDVKKEWKSIIEDDIKWCKIAEKICFSFVDTHYNMAKAYLYKYICDDRISSESLNLAKEQINIATAVDPNAPGTMFIRRNIYEAEGKFKEAYESVDDKLIQNGDKNDKLRQEYKNRINEVSA